jgi:hypothetical protein
VSQDIASTSRQSENLPVQGDWGPLLPSNPQAKPTRGIELEMKGAFLKALEHGREAMDRALEATALQRALGYSYENGVRMTVTETLPPNEFLLKFFLERRMPDPYRPSKKGSPHT